jgi:hypothetical protein
MHICINIFGQIRFIEYLKKTIEESLLDNNHTYHILFTTWNNTDITKIKELLPNIHIKQYDYPDINNYKYLTDNYRLDITQPSHKTIQYYILGHYIKSKSFDTIIEYEKNNNVKFDIIITMRTYTNLYNNKLQHYYDTFNENNIYTASDPCFTIYNSPSYPDVFEMAKRKEGLDILQPFDVLHLCTAFDNIFHPETSSYKIILNKGYIVNKLKFNAYVYQ